MHMDIECGVRVAEKETLVERITIKIKVFDNGKCKWKVNQIYRKNPQVKQEDFVRILDEIKTEALADQ